NGLGFNILFYIAGLQNVPGDLLEAAAMDGANRVQRFVRITIPLLSPFTFFLLVANVTYAFYGIYGVVDATTQGGPPLGPGGEEGGATGVLIYKLYEDAFGSGSSAGMAAAQALILFILVATITLLQFRYVENRVTYNA
ncbi:MAG TPA: ABC transporter permease subunit, partial [Aggregatilineales bacterium]|nr:ABC transporter permease subunit [Aggregatilineales bacterium]